MYDDLGKDFGCGKFGEIDWSKIRNIISVLAFHLISSLYLSFSFFLSLSLSPSLSLSRSSPLSHFLPFLLYLPRINVANIRFYGKQFTMEPFEHSNAAISFSPQSLGRFIRRLSRPLRIGFFNLAKDSLPDTMSERRSELNISPTKPKKEDKELKQRQDGALLSDIKAALIDCMGIKEGRLCLVERSCSSFDEVGNGNGIKRANNEEDNEDMEGDDISVIRPPASWSIDAIQHDALVRMVSHCKNQRETPTHVIGIPQYSDLHLDLILASSSALTMNESLLYEHKDANLFDSNADTLLSTSSHDSDSEASLDSGLSSSSTATSPSLIDHHNTASIISSLLNSPKNVILNHNILSRTHDTNSITIPPPPPSKGQLEPQLTLGKS
jgi:hypothetical protein